ncbi:NAD(P)H-binding protein [Pseudonocardia sichuanensis]
MTVLITGGTGTTGSRVAAALRGRDVAVRIASRRPAAGQVRFEWTDPATHAAALDGVRAVYLVAPVGVADPAPIVAPFLDEARERGVRRVVLLSSSAVPEGAPGLGELHRMVCASAPEPTVLRPSWFMQNFLGDHPHAYSARTEGEIVTATGSGRVAFVDAGDIAAVAAQALSGGEPHVGEYVLTGPEALSYAEVAAVLTEVTGHPVGHRAVEVEELTARLVAAGYPSDFSAMLAGLDADVARGVEDRTTSAVQDVTGRPPRSLREVVGDAHLSAGVAR